MLNEARNLSVNIQSYNVKLHVSLEIFAIVTAGNDLIFRKVSHTYFLFPGSPH